MFASQVRSRFLSLLVLLSLCVTLITGANHLARAEHSAQDAAHTVFLPLLMNGGSAPAGGDQGADRVQASAAARRPNPQKERPKTKFIPPPANSSTAAKTSIYLDVKNLGNGTDGVWESFQEPNAAEVRANMLLTAARNQKRLQNLASVNHAGAESMDIDVDGNGVLDLAVIVDNGAILVPAVPTNPLDLQPGMRIRYTPTGAGTFHVELAANQSFDPTLGSALALTDDSFAEVAFPAAFPFLGTTYNALFVGSDGHITFGVGDSTSNTRDAARHIGGPPRLSVLLTDLNPDCSGSIHADVRTDRVVVTWDRVVHFERGAADGCGPSVPANSLQAILYANGAIDFLYGALDTGLIAQAGSNREAVTGIAEGNAEGPLHEIDLTADLPLDLQAGAIFEQFSQGSPETFDLVQLAREFYRTHGDQYDYLVMFTDFEIFGGGTAFNAGIQNQTLGLGQALFDNSALLGSGGELESFVWMNNINLWFGSTADDYSNPPLHRFAVTTSPRLIDFLGGKITPTTAPYELVGMVDLTGQGNQNPYTHHGRALIHENPHTESRAPQGALRYSLNSAISIMFQEADHRWSAFSAFVHPTKGIVVPDSFDLLGRGLAHWSTFFNTQVVNSPFTQADGLPRFSGMEGNALLELALDSNGRVVDKNNPSRILADPQGKLANALAACAGQGKGVFLTEPEELIDGSTELDQYLMGVRRAAEVSPFWYVDEPSSPLDGRSLDEPFPTDFIRGSTFNVDDIAFCGVRVNLTVTNITDLGTSLGIPARGPRVPVIGDENDIGPRAACLGAAAGPCADVKTMAWILLVRSGPPNAAAHMPAIQRLNEFRTAWQAYTNGPGLGGRNADGVERPPSDPNFVPKFDTSLEPVIH